MRILLIGGRSYVGQSVTSVQDANIEWVPISRYDFRSPSLLKQTENIDAIVVIATPAMSASIQEWRLDENVRQFLIQSPVPKLCISSIRADDDLSGENKHYINTLRSFETHAIINNWLILRISNFLGLPPLDFPNQKRLLPWALIPTIRSGKKIRLNSVPSQLTEWVNGEDVSMAIKMILSSNHSGKFTTRPSFEINLSEIVDLIVLNFRTTKRPINIEYGLLNRIRTMTTNDNKLSTYGWKTNVNSEVFLDKLFSYGKQESNKGS